MRRAGSPALSHLPAELHSEIGASAYDRRISRPRQPRLSILCGHRGLNSGWSSKSWNRELYLQQRIASFS
jgi:hypothetical protein